MPISLIPNENLEKYCVGSIRVSYGKWYSPNGQTPQDCTYCNFCIENGCIPRSEVWQLTEPVKNCNCDCPKQKQHPRIKEIQCPTCRVKQIGRLRCATCGTCSHCQCQTSYIGQKFCSGCSWLLNSCKECGQEIQDGNFYIEAIKKKIEKLKAKLSEYPISGYPDLAQKQSVMYDEILKNAIQEYSGKSRDEILRLLRNHGIELK